MSRPRGYKHTEATRKKLSEGTKLRYEAGILMGFRVKPLSEEGHKKVTDSLRGRKNPAQSDRMKNNNPLRIPDIVAKRRREGHPMWKGGRHVRFKWGFHTTQEWEQLKKQYNYMCPCCHKREPQIRLEKDHIVSATEGGPDIIENIQPLCRECNVKKGIWTIYYRTNKFYSGKRVSEKIKSMEVKRSNWEKDMRMLNLSTGV